MQVGEIMTSPAVTVPQAGTLREATGRMLDAKVGSVVVVDAGIVGILTRSDVLRAAYHAHGSLSELPVSEGMSGDVVTTKPTTSVSKALSLMEQYGIKKLPVVEELELVGMVTMTDVARHQPERVREAKQRIERKDEWTD